MLPHILQQLVNSYCEAAIWTDEDRLKEDDPNVSMSIYNFSKDAAKEAFDDIEAFIRKVGEHAIEQSLGEYGADQIGHDLWLTRNGHGAGFWDRDYKFGELLTDVSKEMGEITIYINDNGKFEFM
jgi:hypothetical protein